MGKNIVKLSKTAFTNMLTACLEVYKKESYGVLLGKSFNGHSIVRNSLNYQSARRTYDFVDLHPHREKRVINTIKYLPNNILVGDFHSHPDFPDKLSKFDRKDLVKQPNKWVSMLFVIKDAKKKMPWRYNESGKYFAGTVGGKFSLKLHAYKNIEGKVKKINIDCPYVQKLNIMHFS